MPEVYSPVSGNPSVAPSAPIGQSPAQAAYDTQQTSAQAPAGQAPPEPQYVPQSVVVGGQQPVNQQPAVNTLPPGIYSVPGATEMQPIPQMQAAPAAPAPAPQAAPSAAYAPAYVQQTAAVAAPMAAPQMQPPVVQASQPSVQLPPQAQQIAPSRIYSHNTRAVWHARRSTKATYFFGIIFLAAGVFLAGMYWLSIGAPTAIEDLPLTQQLLGR